MTLLASGDPKLGDFRYNTFTILLRIGNLKIIAKEEPKRSRKAGIISFIYESCTV